MNPFETVKVDGRPAMRSTTCAPGFYQCDDGAHYWTGYEWDDDALSDPRMDLLLAKLVAEAKYREAIA